MIKIGCSGYPVSKDRYHNQLGVVELASFEKKVPTTMLLNKWKTSAPSSIEFIIATTPIKKMAHQFKAERVRKASPFSFTLDAAALLKAKVLFFKLTGSFHPSSDNVKLLQDFFKAPRPDNMAYVWEPPTSWPESLVRDLSLSLRLVPVANPLEKNYSWNKLFNYYRITDRQGTIGGPLLPDHKLRDIHKACDKSINYVIFNTGLNSFKNALRLTKLVAM